MQLHPLFAFASLSSSSSASTSSSSPSLPPAVPPPPSPPHFSTTSPTPAGPSPQISTLPTSIPSSLSITVAAPSSKTGPSARDSPLSHEGDEGMDLEEEEEEERALVPSSASSLNQASLLAAASKLLEMNTTPVDELLMQEVTQRLVKMNQEISGAGGGGAELKMAEKIVSELSSQQSNRNSFNLNERTLQECWNTLQRVSCMIFMHKSAMQLQQQQQNVHQGGGGGGGGSGSGSLHGVVLSPNSAQQHGVHSSNLPRPSASSSPGGSENGNTSKPHQCHQCLKAFSSNHQLVQHVRVHTGEKPYKCSYCDRRFKQLSHVQQHTRLHTGERPYKCHVHECGRAFIQLSNLQQHLRNHDAQLERSKNRPFHCSVCGKGFATESSLRTHTAKVCKEQHAALIGGPNAVSCPICHKLFLGGEALMEHMKHTHKDPNASGVATKRRTANHPCPICGKHYVNEGSLRKHLTCHPETAQLSNSLRMWPCSVCQAVFTHESGLLTHMEQMRMDPKHSFAAQYVLSRAAAERRERENILSAVVAASMNQGQQHFQQSGMMGGGGPPSPSGSESSGRLSSPVLDGQGTGHGMSNGRLMSPGGPLDARISSSNNTNTTPSTNPSHLHHHNNNNSSSANNNNNGGDMSISSRKDYSDKYESPYDKMSGENNNIYGSGGSSTSSTLPNPSSSSTKYHEVQHAAMQKMAAAMLSSSHPPFHHQGPSSHPSSLHGSGVGGGGGEMGRMQAEALLRSQAEALRLAVVNGGGPNGNGTNHNDFQSQGQSQVVMNGHHNGHPSLHHHHSSLNQQQLNSLLSGNSDLSEALLRLDPRSLGFPLPAHNS